MSDLKNIQDTRQLQVTWPVGYINNAGNVIINNLNFNVMLPDLYFQPNFVVLKEFHAVPFPTAGPPAVTGRDDFVYRINTNLSDQPVATFINGALNVPQTTNVIISIRKPITNINFSLERLNVVDEPVTIPDPPNPPIVVGYTPVAKWVTPTPTRPLLITLMFDLIAVKDYRSDKVAVP